MVIVNIFHFSIPPSPDRPKDWDHYCEKFRFEGRDGPDFPLGNSGDSWSVALVSWSAGCWSMAFPPWSSQGSVANALGCHDVRSLSQYEGTTRMKMSHVSQMMTTISSHPKSEI